MKAIVTQRDLQEGVGTVARAVSGRSSLPILSHLLLQTTDDERIKLVATDLEVGIEAYIPASIQQKGALTVPARIIQELLSTLPDDHIALAVDAAHTVNVRCGRSDAKIHGLPPDEFPVLPEVRDETHFSIGQDTLKDMIRQTIFAVSRDEARAILTGILVDFDGETLKFVATDTHRLAVRQTALAGDGRQQAIVPARAMNELARLASYDGEEPVLVRMSDSQILFKTPNATLVSRLIEGQFPNYSRVIPADFQKRLTLETTPFLQTVRRASIFSRDNANRVILRTEEDKLRLSAQSGTVGDAQEEIEVAREGDDVEIAFNAQYMMDVLSVLDSEGVYLELTESLRPGVFKPVDRDDYLCVLMPMQIV